MRTVNEYIKITYLDDNFDKRATRMRIKHHFEYLGSRSFGSDLDTTIVDLITSVDMLTDDGLVALDEYLNCYINLILFREFLLKYRLSEIS